MPRKLRFAVSVFFGLLTAALCVLWVRSYSRMDGRYFKWGPHHKLALMSLCGEVGLARVASFQNMGIHKELEWQKAPHYPYRRITSTAYTHFSGRMPPFSPGFRWTNRGNCWYAGVPCWFLGLGPIALGAACWIWPFYRFSLRTLLIATTLLAVVLGLAVWAAR